jgi:hypothetical protein
MKKSERTSYYLDMAEWSYGYELEDMWYWLFLWAEDRLDENH